MEKIETLAVSGFDDQIRYAVAAPNIRVGAAKESAFARGDTRGAACTLRLFVPAVRLLIAWYSSCLHAPRWCTNAIDSIDHAIGTTRLNAYAGLATGYLLRDAAELDLMATDAIPPPEREIPPIIQDKIFDAMGNLWYPSVYDQQFFAYMPPPGASPLPVPSTGAEFWGDTMLVNGTAFPFLQVEPRR